MEEHLCLSKKNKHSFVEMVERQHGLTLWLYSVKLCKAYHYDTSYAHDMIQNLFLKIMEKEKQVKNGYHKQGKGVNYLFKMLRNGLIDKGRKKKSEERVKEIYADTLNAEISIHYMNPELSVESIREILHKHLPEKRAVIMDFYYSGFSYQEIADRLGMPIGTVGTEIKRSKEVLGLIYGGEIIRRSRRKRFG